MKPVWITLLLILSGALWVGCTPRATSLREASPSPLGTQRPATSTPYPPTETPSPSSTPQISKVLLVVQGEANGQAVQSGLSELAAQSKLVLEVQPSLQGTDLTPDIKIVVLLSAPENLEGLLSTAPQIKFIVVSSQAIDAASNLTLIRTRPETQAFLAGFISVLLSNDYRAAGLLVGDGPLGADRKEAFVNGGHYFCGLCSPGCPPNVLYPVTVDLPETADGASLRTATIDLIQAQKVEVFYLSAEAVRAGAANDLQGKTQQNQPVILLGETAPPDKLKMQWAGSVEFDLMTALRQAWPSALAGQGGGTFEAYLQVVHINPDLLGDGRMRLVNNLIELLKNGQVYPLSVPAP